MSVDVKCQNCEWTGDDSETKNIEDVFDRVEPGEIMPYGECPECGALCHGPSKTVDALEEFVDCIEQTGGLVQDPDHGEGYEGVPEACHDWGDLGDAYISACKALGKKPMIHNEHGDLI
jgi:hypothetical protein